LLIELVTAKTFV